MASFCGENTNKKERKNRVDPCRSPALSTPFITVSYARLLDPMHCRQVLRVIVVSYASSSGVYMSSLGSYASPLGSTHRCCVLCIIVHHGWGPECRLVGEFEMQVLSTFTLIFYLPRSRSNYRHGIRCRCDRFAAVAFDSLLSFACPRRAPSVSSYAGVGFSVS